MARTTAFWWWIVQLGVFCQTAPAPQIPATPKRPAVDTYHGVAVTDDYRWLENYADPIVRAWSDAQNHFTRKYLDAVPVRASLYDQLKQLYSQTSPR